MCDAVVSGRLKALNPDLVMLTTIVGFPAPAKLAGSVKLMMSKPGISVLGPTNTIASPVMAVVPIVIVTSDLATVLTPVRLSSITVGTVFPP